MNMEDNSCLFGYKLAALDLVPYSKLCVGHISLNINFMMYLLQLHM